MIDPTDTKRISEQYILAEGGEICDWLPLIDLDNLSLRDAKSIAQRAMVLSVLVNVSFGAPQKLALDWLDANDLRGALSQRESVILCGDAAALEAARPQLRWNVESLWALAWTGGLFEGLTPLQAVADALAACFPDLRVNEAAAGFYEQFQVRSQDQIYRMLDLFYRTHWHARSRQMAGRDPEPFNLGIVQYRRIPLEWVLHKETDWDAVDLST